MTQPTANSRQQEYFLWFDLDDTVWDMTGNSNIVLRKLFAEDYDVNEAYGKHGVDHWLDIYHKVNADLWRQYAANEISRDFLRVERFARPLRMAGFGQDRADEASRRLDGAYLWDLGSCTALVDGAMEMLKAARRCNYRMGIVSNGFKEVQFRKLESSGISSFFNPVVLSDELEINKPDPRFFAHALARAGVEADNSIMIGDNPETDIMGALAAGWKKAIWYNPSAMEMPENLTRYADRLVVAGSLEQIARILASAHI